MKSVNLLFVSVLILCTTSCQEKAEKMKQIPDDVERWDASLFLEMDNKLGEGAIWNDETGEFWHIDIERKKFFTTTIAGKEQRTYEVGQRIGTIVPDISGQAVLALQNGIHKYDLSSGEMTLLCNPLDTIPEIRFNDGKCDAKGRLWVGSMGLEQKPFRASLYSVENSAAKHHLDSVTISNGIVWSGDNKTMYYIDTPDENVKAYDYDLESGTISNERVVIEIGGIGYPDGMAIDAEGMLWIALWNGGIVGRWNPKNGKLIGLVNVPAHNITSCAFVGEQLDSLIITSARVDMTDAERIKYPLSGSLFVVVPGVKGVKSNFYQGIEEKMSAL